MRLALVLLAAVLLVARPATAAGPSAKKEAGLHYQRGVGLYKEGNYAAALSEFKAAYQAVPSWQVLFNVGLCERRLFRYGQAIATLNRFLEEGGKKVKKDRREAVRKELEEIRALTAAVTVAVEGAPVSIFVDGEAAGTTPLKAPVVLGPGPHTFRAEGQGELRDEKTVELVSGATLTVVLTPKAPPPPAPADVTIESEPKGVAVTIDGKPAGQTPFTVTLPPGAHEVAAAHAGYQPARTDVVATAGQARTVRLTLLRLPPPPVAAVKRPFPVLGVTLLGAGAASAGVGAYFTVQAQGAAREVSAFAQAGGPWEGRPLQAEATGLRAQLLSWVLYGAGAAALVGGVVATVLTLSTGGDTDAAQTFFMAPDARGGVVVGWTGRF